MKNKTFRRFVAVFVGLIVVADLVISIVVGDEKMLGMTVLVGLFYALYLRLMIKKEKQEKAGQKNQAKSPLMRK